MLFLPFFGTLSLGPFFLYLLSTPFPDLAISMRHATSHSFSRWLAHHFGIITFTSAPTLLLVLSTFDSSLYTPLLYRAFIVLPPSDIPQCRRFHARHAHARHLDSANCGLQIPLTRQHDYLPLGFSSFGFSIFILKNERIVGSNGISWVASSLLSILVLRVLQKSEPASGTTRADVGMERRDMHHSRHLRIT